MNNRESAWTKHRKLVSGIILAVGILAIFWMVYDARDPSVHTMASIEVSEPVRTVPARRMPVLEPEPAPATTLQLTSPLEWIPSGYPLALSMDLNVLRRYSWTSMFSFFVQNQVVRRQLDVLHLNADGFDLVAVGMEPSRPLMSWSGRTWRYTLPPHLFFLRGREGRMNMLRRFWQSGKGSGPLVVGPYLLAFPTRHEPHVVVGAWRADLDTAVGMVEKTHSWNHVCSTLDCKGRVERMRSRAHFVLVYVPRSPGRILPPDSSAVLLAGEWNPDGVLLQMDLILGSDCAKNIESVRAFFMQNANRWKLDADLVRRAHFGCGSGSDVHVTLALSVNEIQNQIILFGLTP